MQEYRHSVLLEVNKCNGCTTCLKRCPTEAIRIRNGKAVIDSKRCIDCGQCIRLCPHKAKKASCDKLAGIFDYKYKIALPAPTLYGQFDNLDDIDYVLQGLIDYGFDDVFEVARAAELVTEYTRRYIKQNNIARPVISSACPVVLRLISLRFPYLSDNVIPILSPMEIAGTLAKEKAKKEHPELKDEDICTVFISPCPAKVSYVKNGFSGQKGSVDFVVSMSDIYFELIGIMKKERIPVPVSKSGMVGLSWATSGGESASLLNDRYLAADGIENIIKVLDELETGNFPYLDFIELNACNGGCVGGVLAVENPYIARVRLQNLRRYLPVTQNRPTDDEILPKIFKMDNPITYNPVSQLDNDFKTAMRLMADIQNLFDTLPELDCGSCGSPTCRSFAEDVVKGNANIDSCVVILREKMNNFMKQQEKNNDSTTTTE
ncbi:4Fe-4S dicluster domain-containing protein [Eubacteriales bacterium OttesenSCG-928-G02]|nr:4Fe-4S dicluster domain-containing protein [Eubacteriales bacterium OttesenSCG-928-G02]